MRRPLDLLAELGTLALGDVELAAEFAPLAARFLDLLAQGRVAASRLGGEGVEPLAQLVDLDVLTDERLDELAGDGLGLDASTGPRGRLTGLEVQESRSRELGRLDVAEAVVEGRGELPPLDPPCERPLRQTRELTRLGNREPFLDHAARVAGEPRWGNPAGR